MLSSLTLLPALCHSPPPAPSVVCRSIEVESGPDADTPRPVGVGLLLCMLERGGDQVAQALLELTGQLQVSTSYVLVLIWTYVGPKEYTVHFYAVAYVHVCARVMTHAMCSLVCWCLWGGRWVCVGVCVCVCVCGGGGVLCMLERGGDQVAQALLELTGQLQVNT